jgi:nuclear pore complex protein Nup53
MDGYASARSKALGRSRLEDSAVFGDVSIDDDPELAEQRNETPMAVTVFGFPPSATSMVLSRFRDIGDVVSFTPATQGVNHFTIVYRTRLQAQRALALNGTRMDGWMIGVTEARLDEKDAFGIFSEHTSPMTNSNGASTLRIRSGTLPRAELARPKEKVPVVTTSAQTSQSSDGIYQRVMDLMFGW